MADFIFLVEEGNTGRHDVGGIKQDFLLHYFLAFGEDVFIPTAKLWGI